MKSAYELAMERLKAADPDSVRELSAGQKQELAEIDRRAQARLAEREIFLKQQITSAEAASQPEEAEKLRLQLRRERTRIEEEREDEKTRARKKK
jgi:hypothetical protein